MYTVNYTDKGQNGNEQTLCRNRLWDMLWTSITNLISLTILKERTFYTKDDAIMFINNNLTVVKKIVIQGWEQLHRYNCFAEKCHEIGNKNIIP